MPEVPGDDAVERLVEKAPRGLDYGWRPENWRKIMGGTTYSSETAASIAVYELHEPEYAYRYEELFQTPKGRFLLTGEGRTMSPWGKKLPDCSDRVMGHGFVPLSAEDAKSWLEARGKDQEYLELFGTPDDDSPSETQLLLRLPPSLAQRVKDAADGEGKSSQQWIAGLIGAALKGGGPETVVGRHRD